MENVFNFLEINANYCGNNLVVKVLDTLGRIAKTIKQTLAFRITKFSLNVKDLQTRKYIIKIFTDDNFIKAILFKSLVTEINIKRIK